MKTTIKSIVAIALCAVGLAAFAADPLGSEGNPWDIGTPTANDVEAWTNGTGKLTIEGTGAIQDFALLTDIPWYPVKATITTLEIKSGVTSIGNNAFNKCDAMTSVTIPSGVTSIGKNAFNGCTALTSVTIPSGVRSIGSSVFAYCSGLESVTIPEGVTDIGSAAFSACLKLTSVTIPSSVTKIEATVFSETSLTSVTIPPSVTSIGGFAFNTPALKSAFVMREEPPVAERDNIFGTTRNFTGTIYVPQTSVDAYKGANWWSSYSDKIVGFVVLKIPEAGAHYTYVVSNETQEVDGELADGTNTYTIVYGSAVKVYFTPEDGYVLNDGFVNPKDLGTMEADTVIDEAELPTAEPGKQGVEVTLPTTVGYGFAVSNLTAGAEGAIQPTEVGGTTYLLPIGAKVGIYAVPEEGYVVTGKPYIIEEVTEGTKIDTSKLPTAEPGKPEISAVSAAAELDLTPGDRVARDEETLVVNPAWGGVKTATVQIDGEPKKRTYDCASNDLWTASALEPGRYGMELEAGTHPGAAGFWKVGADWIVLEGSNFAADVTLEGGRTYLVFGTNTIGGTLTAAADSLFLYDEGAPAGFKGEIAELPKMYRLDEVDDLKRIVAKTPGCEDNPWKVGKDGTEVVAWTNGSELVVGGKGTVDALASIKGWGGIASGIGAVKVTDASVTNVAAGAFTGIAGAKVTLPDGWRGEFPDEGDWYGATDIEMASWPLTVQGVKFLQRYPWNGKVDIDVDVTGTGLVKLSVSATIDGKPVTAKTVEGGVVDCGESGGRVKGVRLTWNALADLEPGFKSEHVRIKVTAAKGE